MKQARIAGETRLEIVDVPVPVPSADEVLMRVMACGVCGSDVQEYRDGDTQGVFGHEFSGVVSEVGANVTGVAVGDRIVGHDYASKAFCEYVPLPARAIVPLADELTFIHGALLEMMVVVLTGLRHTGYQAGDTCFVSGCGSIGLTGVMLLKSFGARRIIASNRGAYRRGRAVELGADYGLNPAIEPVADTVIREAGAPVDYALECVGSGPSIKACIDALRSGGILCGLGLNTDPLQISSLDIFATGDSYMSRRTDVPCNKSITIQGITPFDKDMFEVAQRLTLSGHADPMKLVTQTFPFADIEEAFRIAADSSSEHVKIIVTME